MQALATKSFIVYSLSAETPKHVCNRIAKYCDRGFNLLVPLNFDGDFNTLMQQEEIPRYRVEQRPFFDDDRELQTSITQFWRSPSRNIDTFRLQDAFVNYVCS
jgi:hypothetical protein